MIVIQQAKMMNKFRPYRIVVLFLFPKLFQDGDVGYQPGNMSRHMPDHNTGTSEHLTFRHL